MLLSISRVLQVVTWKRAVHPHACDYLYSIQYVCMTFDHYPAEVGIERSHPTCLNRFSQCVFKDYIFVQCILINVNHQCLYRSVQTFMNLWGNSSVYNDSMLADEGEKSHYYRKAWERPQYPTEHCAVIDLSFAYLFLDNLYEPR